MKTLENFFQRGNEFLGTKYPIMGGAMTWVSESNLVSAISNAGGLGTISALTQKVPENLKAEIRKYKALSKKPFAVNFTILPAMVTPNYQEMVQAAIDEGVKIIQTAGRSPDSIKLADGRNLMQMMKAIFQV